MKQELDAALAELITKSLAAMDKGAEFLSEQVPEVVQQLLWWEGVRSFIQFLVGVVILGLMIGLPLYIYFWLTKEVEIRRYGETRKGPRYEVIEVTAEAGVIFILGLSVEFIGLLVSATLLNLTWLKIWIAPKIFLIEYAARMFK